MDDQKQKMMMTTAGRRSGTHDSQMSADQKNEEVRILKDFKQMMADRFVPKNIKNLKITMFLLVIVLITLVSVEFARLYS